MRLKIAIALVLLIPSLSWGGAASKLRGVMNSRPITVTANAVNGISSVATAGPTDTGTGTGTGTGTISISATCDATSGGSATVYLVVNGLTTDTLPCATGQSASDTLTEPVSGNYTVQVYGAVTGAGDFSADTFSFPIP